LVQRTFFAGSLSSILITCPPHLSLISSSVINPALYLSSYSNRSLSAPALYNDNTSTHKQILGLCFHSLTFSMFCLWDKMSDFISLRLGEPNVFNEVGLSASRSTLNLKDQGNTFSLVHNLWPVPYGNRYQ
jgi:hypothetical protein